jgi:CHAD domain-containing protein
MWDAVQLSRTPTPYAVASRSAGREALRALESRLRTRRDSGTSRHETYYDTFDWRLHREGDTLTSTTSDGSWLLTWRASDGAARQQITGSETPGFAWDLPGGPFRDALASRVEMRRLLPMVELESESPTLRVLDAEQKTIARIELELASASPPGDTAAVRALAPRIRVVPVTGYDRAFDQVVSIVEADLGLQRDETDDLTRALAGIGKAPGSYTSKFRLTLDPGMPAGEAARQIHRALLETMLANEDGVRQDVDTEFLHDFRVSVRRTRSCLGQIKGVFPPEPVEKFRKEFAWIGTLTGPTRDMDVYLLKMDDYRSTLPEAVQRDLRPLEEFLRRHQEIEHNKLTAGLDSSRYPDLIRHWREFLGAPLPDDPALPGAKRPVREVASERIARCFRRVLKKGRAIKDDSPPARLHRLRIECKKLRYLLEFFRSLYDPHDVEPVVKSLKRLQDNLGDFNDLQIQRETLKRFAQEMVAEDCATVESLMAMGRLVERLEVRQVKERSRFTKRFAEFDALPMRERFARGIHRPEGAAS